MLSIKLQVSHHPPILAFQSESTAGSYQIYGEIEIKNKFWGRSIEVCTSCNSDYYVPCYFQFRIWCSLSVHLLWSICVGVPFGAIYITWKASASRYIVKLRNIVVFVCLTSSSMKLLVVGRFVIVIYNLGIEVDLGDAAILELARCYLNFSQGCRSFELFGNLDCFWPLVTGHVRFCAMELYI